MTTITRGVISESQHDCLVPFERQTPGLQGMDAPTCTKEYTTFRHAGSEMILFEQYDRVTVTEREASVCVPALRTF